MRHLNICFLLASAAVLLSCQHDEPSGTLKPVDERQVLLLTSEGHIYNQAGQRVMELPNCEYASEIISDGDDYFVSGKCTKDRVGYWKNGKWNTLHIDFIDDVEHETRGIGKWDYYIFMFDYPNVLRNSGIFPLQECDNFKPANKCMSVSNGKCYVVGWDLHEGEGEYHDAVLYYEHKGRYSKTILPKPRENVHAYASTIHAYNSNRTIVGGHVGEEPCMWIDQELHMLPRTFHPASMGELSLGSIFSVAQIDGHMYAVGYENDDDGNNVATMWVDDVPQHLTSGEEGLQWSYCEEIVSYGNDWYVLTFEAVKHTSSTGEPELNINILIWLNGNIIAKYQGINIVNFTVL